MEVIGNKTESAGLPFRIDRAAPPVLEEDLKWFYTPDPAATDPFGPESQEITGLTNRTTVSTLTFSAFVNGMITLTVSNIVQGVGDGETDGGRYFLVATNPAGTHYDSIELTVFG